MLRQQNADTLEYIMKILLIDDHALFRAGVRLLLCTLAPEVQIFEVSGVSDAITVAQSHPDLKLCLLDLELKYERGLPALNQIRAVAPEVSVVIVSGSEDRATVQACLDAGAMSYIPKSVPSEILLHALRRVLVGEVFLPPDIIGVGISGSQPIAPSLTPRQREVLYALSRGLSTKLIARELSLSEYTVKEHVAELFRILEVHTRLEAVIKASRLYLRRNN